VNAAAGYDSMPIFGFEIIATKLSGMTFGKLALIAVAVAGCIALPAGEAAACSCSPKYIPSAEQMRKMAPVIFTGIARSSRTIGNDQMETRFEVTEVFQGVTVGQRVLVRHQRAARGTCGVDFPVGEKHTLSAAISGDDNFHTSNLCRVWMFNVPGGEKLIEQLRRSSS